jgi:hypothetical protein
MRNAYYYELAAAERIKESFLITDQMRLAKMAEDGNRRRKLQQLRDWIANVGRVLAARHGAEPNAVKGRA